MSTPHDPGATHVANVPQNAPTDRSLAANSAARRGSLRRLVSEAALVGVTVLTFLILASISDSFRSPANLLNILQQNAIYGIVACGMLTMIISGGFDLSVGATGAAASVAAAHLSAANSSPAVAIGAGLAVGLVVGLTNGFVIGYLHINPFVATLGMSSVVTGLLFVATDAQPAYAKLNAFSWLGLNRTLGIPNAFIALLVVGALTWLLLARTRFGHYVFSVGGNEHAALLSGVNVAAVKLAVYTFGSICASFAGIVLLGTTSLGQPNSATDWPLTAIAICIVGGAALAGGQGRVRDVLVATLLLGMVANGLNQLGVSTYWQPAVTGAVILAAVLLDRSRTR